MSSGMNINSLLFIVISLFILISIPILLSIKCSLLIKQKKYMKSSFLIIFTLFSLLIIFRVIYAFSPGGDAIIDRIRTSNNVELCIIQKSNYPKLGELSYYVGVYYKLPDQGWVWIYYDHQDTRWLKGSIELNRDETMALIKRGSKVVATFNLKDNSFMRIRKGGTYKETRLEMMPENWTPYEKLMTR